MGFEFRMDMYNLLVDKKGEILARAGEIAAEVGITSELKGNIGLSGGSANHAPLLKDSIDSMSAGARGLTALDKLDNEVRRLVKRHYGDDHDGVVINTCEAGLWVIFDSLFSPAFTARGDRSLFRYIAPYERHLHHQGGYGAPVPPRYKDITADRGCTAGELGLYGKRLTNLEVAIVPMVGADYTCHGLKYHPCTMLGGVDADATVKAIAKVAARHGTSVSGFTSMAYDTPGYGYGEKDNDGNPVLMQGIGALAIDLGVPYVLDNARGTPFIGTDLRRVNADLIVYSCDKAFPGPTGGLIIGKEDVMVSVRRALGLHGQRWGTGSSHGKAGYVMADPGKECLDGLIPVLRILLDNPERLTKPVDDFHAIVLDEFAASKSSLGRFADGFTFTKTYNSMCTEIGYENTWSGKEMGFPIFSIEDMYAGSNLIQSGLKTMGLVPCLGYDANMMCGPGLGTCDDYGNLIEERARIAIRGLFRLLALIGEYADTAS